MLGALGVLEAIVWLWRMRTAVTAGRLVSAAATLATTITRVLFVILGASSVMREEPAWAVVLAYAIPATIATSLLPHPKRA